jgi:hypothetical protein
MNASNDVAGKCGVDIAVGKDNEPRAQCGDDLMLEAVGEVRGVKEAQGPSIDRVAFFGDFDRL